MAHNLAVINGRVAMSYVGSNPWHNLGTKTNDTTSVAEAMATASLDWTVSLHDLFLSDGRKAPRVAIVRDSAQDGNPILGTATDAYTPIQNADAFGILDDAAKEYGLVIKTAGALGNGERVWMLAAMPGKITVDAQGGEDGVNGYLLVDTSHDGTGAHHGRFTPIRVVCQNTLTAATSNAKATINIRHTKNSAIRVEQARKLVTNAIAAMKETGDTFNKLAARSMSQDELTAYVRAIFPDQKDASPETKRNQEQRRRAVLNLVDHGKGSELSGRTAWGVYNAVTEYLDHIKPRAAASVASARKAQISALFGQGADLKATALETARELIAV